MDCGGWSWGIFVSTINKEDIIVDFGQALLALKSDHKIARAVWGNARFLLLINPYGYSVKVNMAINESPLLAFIGLKTPDFFVPWSPEQADLLAHDWIVLDK
ncbi:hypothetical protein SPSPH_044360 [Sporomusa sphaeroides DSM 2875]|nr:hypothetical protein SPSPH_26620 [Sporomusa sphaeroides DSM 2875]